MLKYLFHLQGSLIGRISYPGERSSTSSGYSSGSVSANNRFGITECECEALIVENHHLVATIIGENMLAEIKVFLLSLHREIKERKRREDAEQKRI